MPESKCAESFWMPITTGYIASRYPGTSPYAGGCIAPRSDAIISHLCRGNRRFLVSLCRVPSNWRLFDLHGWVSGRPVLRDPSSVTPCAPIIPVTLISDGPPQLYVFIAAAMPRTTHVEHFEVHSKLVTPVGDPALHPRAPLFNNCRHYFSINVSHSRGTRSSDSNSARQTSSCPPRPIRPPRSRPVNCLPTPLILPPRHPHHDHHPCTVI